MGLEPGQEPEVHPDSWIGRTKAAAAEVGIDLFVEDLHWVPDGRKVRLAQRVGEHSIQYYEVGTEVTNQLLITIDALLRIKKRTDDE